MLENEDEWKEELRGFIENYEFPCLGAWNGFHVYISSKLKNLYSFKHRHSVSSVALVRYNKQFLDAAVEPQVSTDDACFLRHTELFRKIITSQGLLNKTVELNDYGEIPIVAVGDSAFSKVSCVVKADHEEVMNC